MLKKVSHREKTAQDRAFTSGTGEWSPAGQLVTDRPIVGHDFPRLLLRVLKVPYPDGLLRTIFDERF
jgi:hypothetical protein